MRSKILLAFAALGLTATLSAHATIIGFSGSWAPATWTTTIVGAVNGGGANNGTVNTATSINNRYVGFVTMPSEMMRVVAPAGG